MNCTFALKWALALFAVYLATLGYSQRVSGLEREQLREYIKELNQSLPEFFPPNTQPTLPVPVDRAIAEWEPTAMLLLGSPLTAPHKYKEEFQVYAELIDIATRYVDVGILHETNDLRNVPSYLRALASSGVPQDQLDRVHFIESQSSDYWVRDFGPLFGYNANGDLLMFDNSYRIIQDERETWGLALRTMDVDRSEFDADGFYSFRKTMRACETAPAYVSKFIRQHYQFSSELVRPPIYLQGGDYMTDGEGRMFISEDTLLENGGNIRELELIFKNYYGTDELYVLNTLPGNAVRHLDLLMKLVDKNTVLMTEAPTLPDSTHLYNKILVKQIADVQASNEAYLRRNIPDLNIIKVPMPMMVTESANHVIRKAKAKIIARICNERGIDFQKFQRLKPEDPQRVAVQKRINAFLSEEMGEETDLDYLDDFNRTALHYLGADADMLVESNVDAKTVYRSYANSILLTTAEQKKVWILPRYKALLTEDPASYELMEQQAESAYRSIYPEAEIYWVDSDAMAENLGALHCISMNIPFGHTKSRASKGLRQKEITR